MPAPTIVQAAAGTEVLAPTHGAPATVVFVSGSGWTGHSAGEACTITSNVPALIVSPSCSFTGLGDTIAGSFTVGLVQGGSSYTVTVTSTANTDAQSQPFTVDPGITLTPTSGLQAQVITIDGGGFTGTGLCSVTPSPPSINSYICSINGGLISSGSQFVVGPGGPGGYTVTVVAGSPATGSASAPFTVTTAPTLTANPTDGAIGLSVSVSGTGFNPSDTSAVLTSTGAGGALFSGNPLMTGITSGPYKNFAGTFSVASTATVTVVYTLKLTGNPVGDFATATFKVDATPTFGLSVVTGSAGNVVPLAGAGFSSTDDGACTVSSVPAGLATAVSCQISGGSIISGSQFLVSASAPGQAYSVSVTGKSGDVSSLATFTVTAAVKLSPTSGSPPVTGPPSAAGTTITISGTGFNPSDGGCTITVTTGTLLIGAFSCTVSAVTGSLTATFVIGSDSPLGASNIEVTGSPAGDSVTTVSAVTVVPQLVLSPTSGPTGTTVNFAGAGFSTHTASATPCTGANLAGFPLQLTGSSCSQSVQGNVVGHFTISGSVTPGTYPITYSDADGTHSATTILTVTGGPTITLSATSGASGDLITFTGTNFDSADVSPCVATLIPTGLFAAAAACTVSSSTQVSGSFTVAAAVSPGTYVIQIAGTTGDKAYALFTVGAPTTQISLSPNVGPLGTVVAVSGSGFNLNDAVACTLTGPAVTSASCQVSTGNVVASFTVPNSAPQGLSFVLVSGSTNDFAVAIYSVPVLITATTTTTPAATSVTTTSGSVTTISSQTTLTTTTSTFTGVSSWITYTRTTTTISGQSTVSASLTTTSTQMVTSARTSTTKTTTTTTFSVVTPHVIGQSMPSVDWGLFGLFSSLALVVWPVVRRLSL